MADIYGQSDAALAQKAANTYAAGVPTTLDQINKQIAATSAELEAKIKVGLTDVDKADIASRLDALKTQATQAINNTRSNYEFAQQQNALSGQATQQSMADIQNSQAALAAQALGMTRTSATPGGYAPQVSDYLNLSSRISAADLAATGGEGSVPFGAQVNVPSLPAMGLSLAYGPQAGLAGISQMASTLFSNTLQGSAARAKSDIEQQQVNLGTSIEQNARDAARAREQSQRDALQSWILQQKGNAITTASSMNQDLLKLQASAASADTRTGRQKAQAEVDMAKKKAAIEFKNALALQNARADAAGLTDEQKAEALRLSYIAKGESTPLIQTGYNKIATTLSSSIPNKVIDGYTYKYVNGNLIVTGGKSPIELNPYQIVQGMSSVVGDISTKPKSEQAGLFKDWYNNSLNSVQKQALALVYGNPKPANWKYYYDMINAPMPDFTKLPPTTPQYKTTYTIGSQTEPLFKKTKVEPPRPILSASKPTYISNVGTKVDKNGKPIK